MKSVIVCVKRKLNVSLFNTDIEVDRKTLLITDG